MFLWSLVNDNDIETMEKVIKQKITKNGAVKKSRKL